MGVLFVAGAGTDAGKTYVGAAVIRALRARGVAAEAFKPLVSGFDPDAPEDSDPAVLLAAQGIPWSAEALERISPWRYRAPLAPCQAAAREGGRVDAEAVIGACRERAAAAEGLLLVESAGGIMSPLDERRTMLDLAEALGAPVLLVTGSYLGAMSHTLTAAAVIADRGLPLAAVVVSETAAEPPLDETLAMLEGFLPGEALFAVARGAPAPEALAERLAGL
ncbi:MAG TPA: dethiobiotin synthase [Caulobacteraceae bacterium]|nr:dethiobiotin synthase [Caulobacteraceae bacterium]